MSDDLERAKKFLTDGHADAFKALAVLISEVRAETLAAAADELESAAQLTDGGVKEVLEGGKTLRMGAHLIRALTPEGWVGVRREDLREALHGRATSEAYAQAVSRLLEALKP